MNSVLRIASRKSDLARLQAYEVGRAILRAHPEVRIEYRFSSSLGDANLNDPLWKMPEKGVFTADLSEKLALGECDLVVHSWKDLPTEVNPRTEIVATRPRADVRDVVLVKRDHLMRHSDAKLRAGGPRGAVEPRPFQVFSSSPRREYNIRDFLQWSLPTRQQIIFSPVRGNVATRAQKYCENQKVSAWVVAKAALDRLLSSQDVANASPAEFATSRAILRKALSISKFQVLPVSQAPTAPAQGALAVEIARDREDMRSLLQAINDQATWFDVCAEREIFQRYGGGCHQKIGITYETRPYGQIQNGRGQGVGQKSFWFTRLVQDRSQFQIPKTTREHIYPLETGANNFVSGRRLIQFDRSELKDRDLFVARADAWPENFGEGFLDSDCIAWASGIKTWRKLAARGIWVSGCQDGRGETEPMALEHILGRLPQFTKLTHREGDTGSSEREGMPIVATYELVDAPESDLPDLTGKTHFYWSSFSQFERADRHFHDVLQKGYHSCGPGSTYERLRNVTSRVSVYLSHESWLQDVL